MIILHYKTKKELKESIGKMLRYSETSLFGLELDPSLGKTKTTGTNHPKRSWFATVEIDENYILRKVK